MKPACFAPLLWMVLSALEVGCAEAENTLQKIAGYQPQFDMTDVVSSSCHHCNPCRVTSFQTLLINYFLL